MQKLTRPDQRSRAPSAIDTILEREMRVANRLHELCTDDGKRTASFSSAIVADHLPMNTFVTRHLVVRVARD